MQRYPLNRRACRVVLFFIAGIACAKQVEQQLSLLFAFCLIVALIVGFRRRIPHRWQWLGAVLAFAIGAALFWHHNAPAQSLANLADAKSEHVIEGRVLLAPAEKTWLHMAVSQVDGTDLSHPVTVRVLKPYGDATPYERASLVRFQGALLSPEGMRNPGGFNEEAYLFSKGIAVKMKAATSGETILPAAGFQQQVNRWQEAINTLLTQNLSEEQNQLTQGVLFGDTGGLHNDFYSLSQRLGIIHIFSVSGLHVGFIVAFVMGIAVLLKRQNSWGTFFFLLPLLFVYIILSGLSPPAMRAGLMAMLGLLAFRLLRYGDLLTILALSAAVLLSASPNLLWDIGFQLSFLITGGIIYGYPAVRALFFTALPERLTDALALSLTAELVSAPLVAWYFYMLAPFSILMNLLVVPLFSLMVPLALVAIVLGLIIPVLAPFFFIPVQITLYVVVAIMRVFDAAFGSGHIYVGQPGPIVLVLYVAVLLLLFSGFAYRRLGHRQHQGAAAVLVLLVVLFYNPLPKNQTLTVLDVGQGSSAVWQTEKQKWLIFDTGMAADTTAQFMRYAAVNRIEAVVLSHGDADHINGLAHLLRDFKVNHLFLTTETQNSEAWQVLAPVVAHKGIKVHQVEKDMSVQVGETALHLKPSDQPGEAQNAVQLLAMVQTPNGGCLFPGDASTAALRRLSVPGRVDFILVPHHGSKNSWSEEMYTNLQPEVAIVSCGQDNRFGHPHTEVVNGLRQLEIPLLRTDDAGALSFYRCTEGYQIKKTALNKDKRV